MNSSRIPGELCTYIYIFIQTLQTDSILLVRRFFLSRALRTRRFCLERVSRAAISNDSVYVCVSPPPVECAAFIALRIIFLYLHTYIREVRFLADAWKCITKYGSR